MNAQIFNNYAFLNENSSLQRWLLHDQQYTNAIRDDVLHTKKNRFFRNYLVISGCIIFFNLSLLLHTSLSAPSL